MHRDLLVSVSELLGRPVDSASPVHGGDVAAAYRVQLSDGSTVFAKTRADAPAGGFRTEAVDLAELRSTGTVAVPEVLALGHDPAVLVLEWIERGRPAAATDAELGRVLAALHRSGSACFGREDRSTTGSRGLPNEPCASWAAFLAERRLGPLGDLAARERALDPATIRALGRVAGHLPELLGPEETPARLHGDLWAGNRVVDRLGVNWLIDPACFGGHREFDLAMMRLFGGFSEHVFAAYHEAHPLAAGWEERVELHQLAPLVVHAIKFGGAYVGAASSVITRYDPGPPSG